MSVFHVLKDGSRPTDITGHIVRMDDVKPLYQFLHTIDLKSKPSKKHNTYERRKKEVVI